MNIQIDGDQENTVIINGVTYTGTNIIINDGKVTVDGDDRTPEDVMQVSIEIIGNVGRVDSKSGDITITGDVGSIQTKSGSVSVAGSVTGSVSTKSGSVTASDVAGNVSTKSGDITTQ